MAITPLALAFAAAGAGLSAAAAIQKNEAVKSSFAAQQQQIKRVQIMKKPNWLVLFNSVYQ